MTRYTSALLISLCYAILVVNATLQIVPGGTWTASNGEHVQAHGAGVIKVDNSFYLIGEDKTNGSSFQNVNCYRSEDLVQWTYVGALLSRTTSGDLGPNRIVERPKVIYNNSTKKYVLWFHADSSNYGDAKVGVATADSVCGKYTYLRSFQPLGFQSRDIGLFKDDDGTAYLLTEDRANGVRINKLTSDYLDVAGSTHLWPDHIEAPAMVKISGRYYFFGSKLTGWDPNDNVYSTSTSLTSGWSAWATFADKGSKTYNSQTHYVLEYGNGNVMYMGDRWVSGNLMTSTYVWLPLTLSGTTVTMKNYVSWVPNVGGAWASPPSEGSYEGEAAVYATGAKDVSCSGCSGGKAAGYIGGSSGGRLTIGAVKSNKDALNTVRVKYMNGDSSVRYADVSLNGGPKTKLAFLKNGADPSSSTWHVNLKGDNNNTVSIEGLNSGWGPDVDRLMVPVE